MSDVGDDGNHLVARIGTGTASRNELSGTVFGPAVQAGSIHGDVNLMVGSPAVMPVPRQLLPAPVHFTGRVRELAVIAARS